VIDAATKIKLAAAIQEVAFMVLGLLASKREDVRQF
jgi:hypothetical protein